MLRQLALHRRPRAAGLDRAGHVLPRVLAHCVMRVRLSTMCAATGLPQPFLLLLPRGHNRESVPVGEAQNSRNLSARLDGATRIVSACDS